MPRQRHAHVLNLGALLVVLALMAVGCAGGASASGDGSSDLSVRISSPADGTSVAEPFVVKLTSSVPLGDPDTGDHHVHLCFDGNSCDSEYTLAYGNSISVSDLAPGEHTITASLRNADHSDAGAPTDSITVTVTRAGASSPAASPNAGASPSRSSSGYGY